MKIGIVTTWFVRGAAYVSRQYRDLLSADHEVFIYARGGEAYGSGDKTWDGPGVTWGRRGGPKIATYIDKRDFFAWIRKQQLDVVFFTEQHFWLPVAWCSEVGVKTGSFVDFYTETTIPFFGAYDFLICNTRRHVEAFDWHEQAYYVPWGTDLELFTPVSLDPVDPASVVFFHCAGMSPSRKGTDQAIRAFGLVRGSSRLIVHTQVSLEQEFPELVQDIKTLVQAGRLEIIQKTVPLPGLYTLGDVFVYPSRLDGLGLSIAEALACGLPIIVPDQPPMREFIDVNPPNGTLVPVTRQYARSDGFYWPQCRVDVAELAASMQKYIDSREYLGAFKRSARAYAEKHLDWRSRLPEVARIFEKSQKFESEAKDRCIAAAIAYERGRWGSQIELWARLPRLAAAGAHISAAARAVLRPLTRLAKRTLIPS